MSLTTIIHPGEQLAEFLREYDITPYRLAKDTRVPATRIGNILAGKRAVTPDTALRLGRYFGTSAEYWMNLQVNHELALARRDRLADIRQHVTPLAAGEGAPKNFSKKDL